MAAGQGSGDAENGVALIAVGRFASDHQNPGGAAAHSAGSGGSRNGQGLEVYGDSHYGSGQARADYAGSGHNTVIKPIPVRPAVPGGFTLDDFTIDEDNATVTCPAGVTRTLTNRRSVTFGAACASCPLRQRCTTSRRGRHLELHPYERLMRAARAQARTAEFKQAYPTRAVIERVIAWTAVQNGRRVKLRYLGDRKNDAWLQHRCAALNLRTLVNAGLTCHNEQWAIA
jgi:hypothetical protein